MKLIPITEIFEVEYGNSLELNKLELSTDLNNGVNFISRSAKNNGCAAIVKELLNVKPFDANLVTVSLGGSVLEAFLQPKKFYTSYHVMVLSPRFDLTINSILYYCSCIRKNKFRYSYGRQANKTIKDLLLPANVPSWIDKIKISDIEDVSGIKSRNSIKLDTNNWKWFSYSDLFDIERGRGPRLSEITSVGEFPFVTSIDENNGWNGWTNHIAMHKANVISVNRNGSVAEAYYQPLEFCSTEDVHIFNPKFELNPYIALFIITLIKKEKYRYSYGRKWGLKRMKETLIKLPVDENEQPNWFYIESFVKSLPYSKQIV